MRFWWGITNRTIWTRKWITALRIMRFEEGLRHLQVEFRQDEIGTDEGQRLWAGRFGFALEKAGL